MSLVQSEDKIFDSAIINGTIYVTTNHGVKMFVGKQFLPIPNGEALVGKRLNGLMPFGKGMMIA